MVDGTTLRVAVLVLAAAPLVYYLLATYCVVDYFRGLRKRPPRNESFTPTASILKPVRGLDSGAYENFSSYCRLNYPEYEIIFAASDSDDPVVPVIQQLQEDFPDRQIRLVTGIERLGENNKVNNLCRLVKEAKYDLLVMTDSDVRVEPDYLREVASPFANPAVGAVTAFARCAGGGTLPADLSMLDLCTDSIPSALVARKLEGKVKFAFGLTMATTKKHLAEIGGWERMVNHHSDDFELGNRIARKGYRVEFMRDAVSMVVSKESLGDFLAHELRWSIGLRNVRPIAYVGMTLTHGLPWAVIGAIVAGMAGWSGLAISYVAAYLILRLTLAWTAGVWGLSDGLIAKKLWLVPLRDALVAGVWFVGFFCNKIHWRGSEYFVRDKLLVPVAERREQRRPQEKPVLQ